MRLQLNGLAVRVPPGLTVDGLLEREGEPRGHVLVEVNQRYVPPGDFVSRVLLEGDEVEIILPAFGG